MDVQVGNNNVEVLERPKILEYSEILKEYQIEFVNASHWLYAGQYEPADMWYIFVSIRPIQIREVLDKVLPLLKELGVPFRLVKDQSAHFSLNEAQILENAEDLQSPPLDFAKSLTIFPRSLEEAKYLVDSLKLCTQGYQGPEIVDAIRISEVIYTNYIYLGQTDEEGRREIHIAEFKPKDIPFKIDKEIKRFDLKRRIYHRRFVPISNLRTTPKGAIYKAIDIKGLRFDQCLIKVGKAYAFEDAFGRDIRTRLVWEMEVIEEFTGHINVPKVYAVFDGSNCTCLVVEWIPGPTLKKKVKQLKGDTPWKDLAATTRIEILKLYMKLLASVKFIHSKGYVHRDLTPSNCIVTEANEVYILDFELTFSLLKRKPFPPFSLGTYGYMSPQQSERQLPAFSDDMYSLGCVLLYMVTGQDPINYVVIQDPLPSIRLFDEAQNKELVELIRSCLAADPNNRPGCVQYIEAQIDLLCLQLSH